MKWRTKHTRARAAKAARHKVDIFLAARGARFHKADRYVFDWCITTGMDLVFDRLLERFTPDRVRAVVERTIAIRKT